ncbi:MAG: hypothetical protein CM15mP49_01690 [Actinomycetota bacterium]|nr:MAG: hypothetical protein CM15mP49_01690 [Actinomycetota bacterium]
MPGVSPKLVWNTAINMEELALSFSPKFQKKLLTQLLNPLAAYQKRFTLEEIMNDVMIVSEHKTYVFWKLR